MCRLPRTLTSRSLFLELPEPHQHIGPAVLHLAEKFRVTTATLQIKVIPHECLPAFTKLGKGLTIWSVLLAAERVADPMKDWPDCICGDALCRRLHDPSGRIHSRSRQLKSRCLTELGEVDATTDASLAPNSDGGTTDDRAVSSV